MTTKKDLAVSFAGLVAGLAVAAGGRAASAEDPKPAGPRASVTKIIDSGPDGEKLVIAVLGDGFAAGDQCEFNETVKTLLLDGLFANDFFAKNRSAFNVYRVNLVSEDSGVGQKVYDENKTPDTLDDDKVLSVTTKKTALKYLWSGSWAHCYLEPSGETQALVDSALTQYVPTYAYLLVILNQDSYGGCGGGGRQYVPKKVTWDVVAHENGHGISALFDEYSVGNRHYKGGTVNSRNITTLLDPKKVVWGDLITVKPPFPSDPSAPGIDLHQTVGLFEGGATVNKGVYRPVVDCRMRTNAPPFCPVCTRLLDGVVTPHLTTATAGAAPAPERAIDVVSLPGTATGLALAATPAPGEASPKAAAPNAGTGDPSSGSQGRGGAGAGAGAAPLIAATDGPAAKGAGGGGAATPAAAPPATPSYLHLVLRVDTSGKATVVSAVQVPGKAVVSRAGAGDYVYELTEANHPVIVRSLPNPFETRAFPAPPTPNDPAGKPEGYRGVASQATIVVKVPNTTLQEAISKKLAFKLYQIKAGPPVAVELNPAAMTALHAANRLEMSHDLPATQLGPELQRIGRKLDSR